MLVHVLQYSKMQRELFLRRWKIDRSKIFPRYARKKNSTAARPLYNIWPLHSWEPSDALALAETLNNCATSFTGTANKIKLIYLMNSGGHVTWAMVRWWTFCTGNLLGMQQKRRNQWLCYQVNHQQSPKIKSSLWLCIHTINIWMSRGWYYRTTLHL